MRYLIGLLLRLAFGFLMLDLFLLVGRSLDEALTISGVFLAGLICGECLRLVYFVLRLPDDYLFVSLDLSAEHSGREQGNHD
jgi:hypothetical protein